MTAQLADRLQIWELNGLHDRPGGPHYKSAISLPLLHTLSGEAVSHFWSFYNCISPGGSLAVGTPVHQHEEKGFRVRKELRISEMRKGRLGTAHL